ncbi:MAG: AraC family transcriptional regulator [Pseudomonadales bacterium]
MEISTVPVHYVNAMLNAAVHRGCSRSAILQQTGIAPELLEQERARIPASTFAHFTASIADELQDENCGFMDRPFKPGTFAMMCYACIHCPTLGQFLERSIRFYDLLTDCMSLRLVRDKDFASYIITPQSGMMDPSHFMSQVLLGITHRMSSWLIDQAIVLQSANFTHSRPGYANEYNFLFMAPVKFEQANNSLRLSANYLDSPIKQNEQSLEKFLEVPSMQLMSNPDSDRSLVLKVRNMIKDCLQDQFPEFETVADKLHFTAVTLRRRLREEGSSYQQIKDDIRRDTAIFNLGRGSMSIEEVAESVGFSEPTSFFRAFKRWTGVTPRAYIQDRQ